MVPSRIGNGMCMDDELNIASGLLRCMNMWMNLLVWVSIIQSEANEELIINRIDTIPTLLVTRQPRSFLPLRLREYRRTVRFSKLETTIQIFPDYHFSRI